jgi:putative hydrolase of the HAD superfamily
MITHIVSDMGGVLVDLEWTERVSALLGREVPLDELHRLWINAQSTVDFESGRIDFDDFATAFIQEFELSVSPQTVQYEFLEFVQAPANNCEKVLAELQQHYQLSLLSNTNPAHYLKLRDRYKFFDYFDQLFLSYEIGVMKPDPAIFQHVLSHLQVEPAAVAFFDDGARNVEAARAVGIQAFQVHSPDELMAVVAGFNTPSPAEIKES